VDLVTIARDLARDVERLRFGPPVTHVYNTLAYAAGPHEEYLRRYGAPPRAVLLVGMNPGPFGMAQTGVPFGDPALVRDFLGIAGPVGRPAREHPKRPILGFASPRAEVSGTRLWGWARTTFGTPARFFARFFVVNYCPLCFLTASGANHTPDKLPAAERDRLFAACDRALARTVALLAPRLVVGIGAFAAARARAALGDTDVALGRILHPSPASPAANRDWAAAATRELAALGVALPG
jgi:single-strand selective monofunctional uracil DNA glycosylase